MIKWRSVCVGVVACLGLSCQSRVPSEKATEVLRELARRMVETPESTDDQHLEWLIDICHRVEVPKRACLQLMKFDVESQKELEGYIVEARASIFRTEEQAGLETIERQRASAVEQIQRQTEVDSNNLIQEYAEKKVRRERQLKATLEAKKQELTKLKTEAIRQENRLLEMGGTDTPKNP